MKKAKIYIESNSPHLSQLITGFLLLANRKKVVAEFIKRTDQSELPNPHCALVKFEDYTILYDMADGYNFRKGFSLNNYLQNVNFYFKRSFSEIENKKLSVESANILPYGFNYHVTCNNNPLDPPISFRNKFHYFRTGQFENLRKFTPEVFEKKHLKLNDPLKVIFYTRLWDPEIETSFTRDELDYINNTRIEIVKMLNDELGDRFSGGIEKGPYSDKICPDLVLDRNKTKRFEYIKKMKETDICIGSIGLHKSIGWKTGEYIAAARAVVNERFYYQVPGNFEENVNYYAFTSVEECLEKVHYLLDHPEKVLEMQFNNRKYYRSFLKPDKLISNTLEYAANHIIAK